GRLAGHGHRRAPGLCPGTASGPGADHSASNRRDGRLIQAGVSMELETKAVEHGQTFEIKQAFDEFLSGFEAFRQANDERLKGLERRSADVLQEEKVARIDRALT